MPPDKITFANTEEPRHLVCNGNTAVGKFYRAKVLVLYMDIVSLVYDRGGPALLGLRSHEFNARLFNHLSGILLTQIIGISVSRIRRQHDLVPGRHQFPVHFVHKAVYRVETPEAAHEQHCTPDDTHDAHQASELISQDIPYVPLRGKIEEQPQSALLECRMTYLLRCGRLERDGRRILQLLAA